MSRIWERYFFTELLKVFALFIFSFYFLYVLIDYSSHAKSFQLSHIPISKIISYYLFQFTKRADILLPIALMISIIKVLTTLNLRNEIVALAASGIPLKSLMRPFLTAALFCMVFLYMNFQFLQPESLSRLSAFEETYLKSNTKEEPVHSLLLEDNSVLVYRKFDISQKKFSDAYWIQNIDKIYRIKTLDPFSLLPKGNFIEELARNEVGILYRKNAYSSMTFPEMIFDTKTLFSVVHPPRWQSITQLLKNLPWKKISYGMGKMNDREAEAATFLFYKLSIPFLSLLAVIAPAPFCLRFTRNLPVFIIYSLSIFGIITFFTLVNSSVILGESQVIPPFWAVGIPQILFFSLFGWRYAKL